MILQEQSGFRGLFYLRRLNQQSSHNLKKKYTKKYYEIM